MVYSVLCSPLTMITEAVKMLITNFDMGKR